MSRDFPQEPIHDNDQHGFFSFSPPVSETRTGPSNIGNVISQIVLCKQITPDFHEEELCSIQKDSEEIRGLMNELQEFMPQSGGDIGTVIHPLHRSTVRLSLVSVSIYLRLVNLHFATTIVTIVANRRINTRESGILRKDKTLLSRIRADIFQRGLLNRFANGTRVKRARPRHSIPLET